MPLDIGHSVCPHDCPSACALDVERIDERRIGAIRGAEGNRYTAGVVCAKVARYVQPGLVFVYHAWEPFQFRDGRSDHAIIPSPFKPTALVGDYGHLHWTYAHWEPNQVDRDTRVEVERV